MNLNKLFFLALLIGCFNVCYSNLPDETQKFEKGKPRNNYLSACSFKSQLGNSKIKSVEFERIQFASGCNIKNSNKIVIHESGQYAIAVNSEIGSQGIGFGKVTLFISINGRPIPSSFVQHSVSDPSQLSCISFQTIESLNKGDSISVDFFSNLPGIGLIVSEGKSKEHKIPSAKISLFKISN